jgi:hypothetical protein
MNRPLVIGLFALLVGGAVAVGYLATAQTILTKPSKVGVLLPEEPERVEMIQEPAERSYQQKADFQLKEGTEVDPNSFASKTPNITVQQVVLEPIYSYKQEKTPPLSMVLLLDNSLSMSMEGNRNIANDPDYRRLEASRTLLGMMRDKDRVSLAAFPPLGRAPAPVDEVAVATQIVYDFGPSGEAVRNLDRYIGQETYTTPLFRGIMESAQRFPEGKSTAEKRIILALTDGQDTDVRSPGLEALKEELERRNITLYVALLGRNIDPNTMRLLTPNVLTAERDTELTETFKSIYRQISRTLAGYNVQIVLEKRGGPFEPGEEVDLAYRAGGVLKAGAVSVER